MSFSGSQMYELHYVGGTALDRKRRSWGEEQFLDDLENLRPSTSLTEFLIISQKCQRLTQNPYKDTLKIPLIDGKMLCVSRFKCATFFYLVVNTKILLVSAIFDWDSPLVRDDKSGDLAKLPEFGQVKLALKNIRGRDIFDQSAIEFHHESLFLLERERGFLAANFHRSEGDRAFLRREFARTQGGSVSSLFPGQFTRLNETKSSSRRIRRTAIWDEVLRLGRSINRDLILEVLGNFL